MVRFVVAMAPFLASPRAWGSSKVRAVCWVGGIAELPDFAGASADEARAPAGGSGWSAAAYAALAGGVATVVLTLGAGAWYARRRWLRQRA